MHCHNMLERGLSLGMEATDLWFDPLFLVVKGMQDKQMDVLNAIKLFSDEGLKSTGGLSNNSNGAPKTLRPIMDATLVAMAMMQGLTSAIVNPCDLRLRHHQEPRAVLRLLSGAVSFIESRGREGSSLPAVVLCHLERSKGECRTVICGNFRSSAGPWFRSGRQPGCSGGAVEMGVACAPLRWGRISR